MLKITIKRLPMLKHNCKRLLFKHNYKEICLRLNTWYTISGVHNANQIQTLKTLEFLRYTLIRNSKWTLMRNNFSRVLALIKLLYESWVSKQQVFTLLYRGVKDTLEIPSTSNRVVWSLIKSSMILCLIWLLSYEGSISNPFQVWRNTGAGITVVLVLLQTKNRVVEVVVVHFVQLSFFNSLRRISIQWLQIHLN